MSFSDLLKRAKGGDGGAVEKLLLPHLPALSAFVRLRISDGVVRRESTADIVQSVCRDALGDLPSVRANDEDGFRAWLFAVVHNKLRNKEDYHRAAKRDLQREQGSHFDAAGRDVQLLWAYGRAVSPSQDAAASEEVARIEAAFDRLPDSYRDVLLHVGIGGLSYRESSRLLGRSEDSVRQLVHRARARLATLLD